MEIEDRTVPADPDVPVRIYRPHRAQGAIIWLHGGGFVMGDLETEHPWAVRVADGSGAVVISVGYRRAPEHRFPAALDDAYAVLAWTAEHAAELGIDPGRIAVGGHAAGAGLAAAVALRARDQQGPPIRYQLLNQPELDDRQETWSARNFTDTPFMTRDKVAASWRHYLGSAPASPYAAPARAADLSGLPPAYIATAEFDPNRDEAISYAQRLLQAGVSVELHQWPGTFHGSQAIVSAEVSQRQLAELAPPAVPSPTEMVAAGQADHATTHQVHDHQGRTSRHDCYPDRSLRGLDPPFTTAARCTWGMALLGLQVVRAHGTRLDPWRGWVRSLTFPLGFLTLGLGFLGILVHREHRARTTSSPEPRSSTPGTRERPSSGSWPARPSRSWPVAVTADGPSPAGQAGSEVGPDALAESGPHPEPSATGEAPPGTGPTAGQ